PVSKYQRVGLSRRPRVRMVASASSRSASSMPKARLAAAVPPTDWKIRSSGAPASTARICVVTWARTETWVGTPRRSRSSWRPPRPREAAGQALDALDGVVGGIDAEDGVAAAIAETLEGGREHAVKAIARMVRLDAGGEAAAPAERGAACDDDGQLARAHHAV